MNEYYLFSINLLTVFLRRAYGKYQKKLNHELQERKNRNPSHDVEHYNMSQNQDVQCQGHI